MQPAGFSLTEKLSKILVKFYWEPPVLIWGLLVQNLSRTKPATYFIVVLDYLEYKCSLFSVLCEEWKQTCVEMQHTKNIMKTSKNFHPLLVNQNILLKVEEYKESYNLLICQKLPDNMDILFTWSILKYVSVYMYSLQVYK
jgi:hypothetical protein